MKARPCASAHPCTSSSEGRTSFLEGRRSSSEGQGLSTDVQSEPEITTGMTGNMSPLTSPTQNLSSDGTLNAFTVDTAAWTKVILQHPTACKASLLDTYNVVWDSGASMCISNSKDDFPDGVQRLSNAKVDGIASHLQLEGVGKVCWSMFDAVGNVRDIHLPAYYAPKARQRLLSTTVFCKHYPKNAIILNPKSWTIQPDPDDPSQNPIDISINWNNNLPMTICHRSDSLQQLAVNFSEHVTTTHAANYNLPEPHKELL